MNVVKTPKLGDSSVEKQGWTPIADLMAFIRRLTHRSTSSTDAAFEHDDAAIADATVERKPRSTNRRRLGQGFEQLESFLGND